ncbi:Protein IQ-domain 1 [Apostasia shenzhenica]|uniref:Protein IQ-domain 1 n=1 Tax=Apostasia shenzhenica TaxID=1088818 RepID=A0A2I0AKX3_9ASPA|nr:Protein IQ-domain 1 [Apostasia shenzhenica]
MGKKGKSWFRVVKNFCSSEAKERKGEKSKIRDSGRQKLSDPSSSQPPRIIAPDVVSSATSPGPPVPQPELEKMAETELEQSKNGYSFEIVNENPADVAAAAAESSDKDVSRHTALTKFSGESRDEFAAIRIQTAFRGYLARRALRGLRGLVRLKSLIQGNAVRRQTTTALRCMQTLARVQSQIRSRRIRMLEENQSLQRQILLNRERELESTRQMSEEWDDSIQSKEQIEAGLLSKQEATIRRERALAYAFSHQVLYFVMHFTTCLQHESLPLLNPYFHLFNICPSHHQWKNSSRSANSTFMDPTNPHWGWSWLEQWMAAKQWESKSNATDKELSGDLASVKSSSNGGEIIKAYARRDTSLNGTAAATPKRSSRPPSRQSPVAPRVKAGLSGATKIKSVSPSSQLAPSDDDSRSMVSLQSEKPRRHSMAGSSVRDDESLASSPAIPSYMAPTESARAKNRLQSPLGDGKNESPEKGSAGSVKKRLSFPASPVAARRHSGPPRVDASVAVKDTTQEQNLR